MEVEKLNGMIQGWRKTGYWLGSLAAMSIAAHYFKATFAEYRDGVVVLAGMVLAGHLYQQAKTGTAGGGK